MYLSLRSVYLGGLRGAGEETARDYTHRFIDLTEADLQLWRVEQGRPEGELMWVAWTSSLARLQTVRAAVRGDRRAHSLLEELHALALAPASDTLLRPVLGAPATMRSRVGDVADYGYATVPARSQPAAIARLTGLRTGAVFHSVWGAQDRLWWWITHRSLDDLDAAGHPGEVQESLTAAELAGRPLALDGPTERLLLTRLV